MAYQPTPPPEQPAAERSSGRLELQHGRELVDVMSRGVLAAMRAETETPPAREFVRRVSQRGAELLVGLHDRGYRLPSGAGMTAKLQSLQAADMQMFPEMPLLERPETARPADIRELLVRHAGYVGARSDSLPVVARPHRENAALAVLNIVGETVETYSDLTLDARAEEQLHSLTQSFDTLYPDGLSAN